MGNEKNYIASFDEYLRQGEPSKRESAANWQTAIGLQTVDGLRPSEYLLEVAGRNIEGEITLEESHRLIHSYYQSKTARTPKEAEEEEADKVSANIARILWSRTFAFNTNGYVSLHRRIFALHSWYFRNALVRANYRNVKQGIDYTPLYLVRFFRNLLLGEQWDLRSRYLHIHATGEWGAQPCSTGIGGVSISSGGVNGGVNKYGSSRAKCSH